MKRRFASPLLIRDEDSSSISEDAFSNLSKAERPAERCVSQPDVRRFTIPAVVKRRDSFVCSRSGAEEISGSSQPDDKSMEVPKTPNSSPEAESASRTTNRRPFHVVERSSRVKSLLSSAPLRRTSSRPLVFEPVIEGRISEVSESRSGIQMEAGRSSSESIKTQSQNGHNPAFGTKATLLQQSNGASRSMPSAVRDEEISQPGPNPVESEQLAPMWPPNRECHEITGKAGNLSNLLRESNFVQRSPGNARTGDHDPAVPYITSLESPTKSKSSNICSLQTFPHPLTLQDIAASSFNINSVIDNVAECAFMAAGAKHAISPPRSAKESELVNACSNKLKQLLVPTSANFVLQNQSPKTCIQIALQLNMVQSWSHSARDSITGNAKSCEAAQPEILVKQEEMGRSATTSAVKATTLMEDASRGNSHLRLPPQLQENNSDHLQIRHGILGKSNHPVTISPKTRTKSDETRGWTLSPKERLSPSALYIAQNLEFRSIWSSKRLKMAEISISCLTQNEFPFSNLV